jgi:signal transduction histidine kinase
VEEMRGTIAATSTAGEGTTFTVTIPVSEKDLPDSDLTIQPA